MRCSIVPLCKSIFNANMSKKWKYVNFETKAANKQQVDEHAAFFWCVQITFFGIKIATGTSFEWKNFSMKLLDREMTMNDTENIWQ